MSSTSNDSASVNPTPPLDMSAAFLALRERSRVLLRERCQKLSELENRLQDQLAELIAESSRNESANTDVDAAKQKIASLEMEVRHLQHLRRDSEQALDEARVMLAEMEDERRVLRERLDGDDVPRSQPSAEGNADEKGELERLQRRLELAMQEIRELKQQNQELGSRPGKSATPPARSSSANAQSFDWETQKQRLLQELDTDFDTSKPEQAKEKLRIEEVIRETDRIIAEKDREIDELKQQLAEQQSAATDPSTDTERQKVLDADETIAAERARLSQIQEEWREKLRKSEVEISIERAKLARERLQLEEKLRAVPAQTSEGDDEGKKPDDPKSGGTPRGRWLNRLGLGGSY